MQDDPLSYPDLSPVSYTHLDVYKRQRLNRPEKHNALNTALTTALLDALRCV